MGTRIEAVSAITAHGRRRPTARGLADAAVQACLTRAGKEPADLDMLINAGVYREDSMGEPALAALIQQDIGANPVRPPAGGQGTFSFDLVNGMCGVLNGIQIEAGLLRSGVIRLGAVVASDTEPDLSEPRPLPYRPVGGAVLLGRDDAITGFADFCTETYPEYESLFTSGVVWQQRSSAVGRSPGRSRMAVAEKPGYRARLVDCAEDAARGYLRRLGAGPGDIDLLVSAPSSADFLDPLRLRLGLPGDRVGYVPEDLEGGYSAGLPAALQAVIRSGRLAEARDVLLLAAGPGITVSLARYSQLRE